MLVCVWGGGNDRLGPMPYWAAAMRWTPTEAARETAAGASPGGKGGHKTRHLPRCAQNKTHGARLSRHRSDKRAWEDKPGSGGWERSRSSAEALARERNQRFCSGAAPGRCGSAGGWRGVGGGYPGEAVGAFPHPCRACLGSCGGYPGSREPASSCRRKEHRDVPRRVRKSVVECPRWESYLGVGGEMPPSRP